MNREITMAAYAVLKRMLLEEFPSEDIVEIVRTWGNATHEEWLAVQELERLSQLPE